MKIENEMSLNLYVLDHTICHSA